MDETDFRFRKSPKSDRQERTDSNKGAEDEVDGYPTIDLAPIRSIPTKETNYNTNHTKMGIALIFNHKNIRGQDPRGGTEVDRDRTKSILKKYGFDVRTFNDLTFEKLNEQLNDVAKEDHSQNDCLVVVVMSHGTAGKVFAKDMTYPVERLWKPFLGDQCKSLINKPKLFFIQACRGSELEKPVTFTAAAPMSRFTEEQPIMTYAIPSTADLLVFYSTFDGYYSFRNSENGSWFIQALCLTLEEAERSGDEQGCELFKLLTTVNRRVAYEYQSFTKSEATNEMKEMPNFVSTLTKTFYFKAKKGQ